MGHVTFIRKKHALPYRFAGNGAVYDSAQTSPARADVPGGFPTDAYLELTEQTHLELVRRVRYLAKNDGVARELVNCFMIYAVGDGIIPQPATTNDKWNALADAYFAQWAKHPDVSGRFTFPKMQKFVCRAFDVDGEIFAIKTEQNGVPQLQLVETHRVPLRNDKEWVCGMKVDAVGRPVAYRVDSGKDAVSVPAEAMIHAFISQTPSDLRGVPWLQHSANHLLDATEFLALEKRAGKMGLDLALVYKVQNPDKFDDDDGDLPRGATEDDGPKRTEATTLSRITGGKVAIIEPGEEVTTLAPTRPSEAVVNFVNSMHHLSCEGSLPFEFVVDNSKIGGAGVRLIVGKAARYFSERQTELIDTFLNPVWRFVIGHAIKTGKLPEQDGWDCVEWVTPRSLTVDAGRDAAQERENVKAGLKTLTDYLAEGGENIAKFFRRRALEISLRNREAERFGVAPEQIFNLGIQGVAPEPPPPEKTNDKEKDDA